MLPPTFHLPNALQQYQKWYQQNQFSEENVCIVTCGDFDLKCLKRECEYKGMEVPSTLQKYINIKEVYELFSGIKKKNLSMVAMLNDSKIELEGKHHSGIDDSRNIAKILQHVLENQFIISKNFCKRA